SPLGGWLHSIGVWDPPFKASSLRRFPGNVFVGEVRGLLDRLDRGRAGPQALVEPGVDLGPLADRRRLGLNIDRSLDFGGLVGSTFRRFRLGQKLDLSQWAHLAAQGRDHYVRIVYEGRLKKFGHRASLVKVTERRFEELNGEPFAWLRQYMYIVVRQPEIHYPDQGLAFGDRAMPLRRVRLTTLVTPHINNPYAPPANITSGSFWIMVDGKPFTFHGWAEDVGGNRLDFTTSFVFVPNSDSTGPSADDHFADIDTALANNPERTRVHVPGHKVTYAERAGAGLPPGGNDNTTYVTDSIDVANEYSARGDGAEAFFKPRITTAAVHLDAVEAVTGSTAPVDIRFTQQYLKGGFAAGGANEVFATLVAPSPTRFNPAQAGGVATPNLAITTLTRAIGPVAGALTDVVNDRFDPSSVFAMVDAVLFGKFPLQKLIVSGGSLGPDGPTLQVQRRNGPAGPEIVTELDWQPPVTKVDLGIVTFTPVPEEGQRLAVTATISTPLTGGEPITEIHGALGAFSITFFDSLVLNFDSFAFTSRTGQKTSVDVSLDQASPVEFRGDLAFVETLSSLLPPGAFGDGVSIDLIRNPLGVRAALDIGLPPATVGVFQLKNIAFSAGLTVPFLAGRPMVEFGFASREKPFLLAVLIFGGGGYFHVQVDTDGLKELEAAFEFGATAGLDIGVASGEVHIMAGIYFKMQRKVIAGGDPAGDIIAQLAGYLRCGGSLCVLGIVRISVEFCLSFTYYPAPLDKAKGRATLTVEVSIACFSKSVELTVERAFGGSSADPTFHDAMPNADLWATYADAFA
ncbi:MAG: hypothetical protein WCG47_28545, partial [Dermatophilaceae bacterium]